MWYISFHLDGIFSPIRTSYKFGMEVYNLVTKKKYKKINIATKETNFITYKLTKHTQFHNTGLVHLKSWMALFNENWTCAI